MSLVEVTKPEDTIAVVALNRPERLNALTIDLAVELDSCWRRSAPTTSAG